MLLRHHFPMEIKILEVLLWSLKNLMTYSIGRAAESSSGRRRDACTVRYSIKAAHRLSRGGPGGTQPLHISFPSFADTFIQPPCTLTGLRSALARRYIIRSTSANNRMRIKVDEGYVGFILSQTFVPKVQQYIQTFQIVRIGKPYVLI